MSREELCAAAQGGARFKMLPFWSHEPEHRGRVGPECLSQWYPAAFEVSGVVYRTAEHWMMAEKARIFGDRQVLDRVLATEHPGAAKKLGREVKGFDEPIWVDQRFAIVVRGNTAKFQQRTELRDFLLRTGDKILVEASPSDPTWGVGLRADDDWIHHPEQWPGQNLLGFALMATREALRGPIRAE